MYGDLYTLLPYLHWRKGGICILRVMYWKFYEKFLPFLRWYTILSIKSIKVDFFFLHFKVLRLLLSLWKPIQFFYEQTGRFFYFFLENIFISELKWKVEWMKITWIQEDLKKERKNVSLSYNIKAEEAHLLVDKPQTLGKLQRRKKKKKVKGMKHFTKTKKKHEKWKTYGRINWLEKL